MKEKWALYARVSTKDKQDLNTQILPLKEWANSNGYDYELFEEKESTRKTRPIKEQLLQRLRKKDFTGLVVLKLDRFARSVRELVLEVTELYEKNIGFISIKENIDLSTATGKLQFHIISAFAEFERSMIRERVMMGLDRARKQGKKLGRPHGAKDRKIRRKSGYYMRYMNTKSNK